jgi:hypothetical protein
LKEEYLRKVISVWGYEFFREESNYPLSMGGWCTPENFGVRCDLLYIPNVPNYKMTAAAVASQHTEA